MPEEALDDLEGMLREVLESEAGTTAEASDSDADYTPSEPAPSGPTADYLQKLGQFTRGTIDPDEGTFILAREFMEGLADEFDLLESVVQMGEQVFQQFAKTEGLDGRIVEFVAGASLYCSCKVNTVPIDPETFAEGIDDPFTTQYLLRRSKMIASTVGLDPSGFLNSTHYVSRYCKQLDLSEGIEKRAVEIIELCKEQGLESGKSPTGWAAAAVYNAGLEAGNVVKQYELKEVANTTGVTIRKRYQEQRDYLNTVAEPPEGPVDCVWWLQTQVAVPDELFYAAADLLAAYDDAVGIDAEPNHGTDWAAAALLLVSKRADNEVSLKMLRQFVTGDSEVIFDREKQLRMTGSQTAPAQLLRTVDPTYTRVGDELSQSEFDSLREQVQTAIGSQIAANEESPSRESVLLSSDLQPQDITEAYGAYDIALAVYRQGRV